MDLEQFGEAEIFRPRFKSERKMRQRAETHLRSSFDTGEYENTSEINSVLQHQFSFYSDVIDEVIPEIASRHFIEFVFFQYDQASKADEAAKSGKLAQSKSSRWKEIGPVLRRGLKFIAERVTLLQPPEVPPASEDKLQDLMDRLWIAAEEAARLYLLSDQTYMVFPDHTRLTIYPEGQNDLLELEPTMDCPFSENVDRDTARRDSYVGPIHNTPLFDHDIRDKYLSPHFQSFIGATYKNVVRVIGTIINNTAPTPEGFEAYFLHREKLTSRMADVLELPEEVVDQAISGFTLTQSDMTEEGRKLFRPKQEYRAFYRGFFEMPHESGKHLAFSKSMAKEEFVRLIEGMTFKRLPPEWNGPNTNEGLEEISSSASDWFENTVEDKLEERGFVGKKSANVIGTGNYRLEVPQNVGEIDYIGYNRQERRLVIVECKLVKGGYEGRHFRDEISKFIGSSDSYVEKFKQKVNWAESSIDNICESLRFELNLSFEVKPEEISAALVTYYPNISQCFIESVPCKSLNNLLIEYDEEGVWPYQNGSIPIS